MEDKNCTKITIQRRLFEKDQLRKEFSYEKGRSNDSSLCCDNFNIRKSILATIPAVGWLSHYKWKRDLLADLTAGFTVAVMHIPQGMAYGLLGNVPPVIGIYMAFFPVLVYFFLGTSRHNSMGTFAVVCLMTGKAVLEHSDPSYFVKSYQNSSFESDSSTELNRIRYSPVEVATTVTFVVAIFQLAMCALRLGAISALLSDTLVSGFTTGAAFQVLFSQLKDLLGVHIPRHKGFFVNIKTLNSIFEEFSTINYVAMAISAVTIIVSLLNNEILKPIVAKRSSFPIPIELAAIVVGTLVSQHFNLSEAHSLATVGEIPSGLPVPSAPRLSLVGAVLLDGFTIAIVSYSISLSMALIFAQKLGYEVNPNQELLAQGAGNALGSFFSCMPVTASLSRSLIQQTVGGRTQVASLVSCAILLMVLLWIGPFFEPLPKCVLASVIVVALKGMLLQVAAFPKFLRLSKLDAVVWLATFLTVVIVSVDVGLLVGVIVSLAAVFALSFKPHTCLLGPVPHTDIYLDINRYKGANQIPGIKIFHYCGGINFATRNIFRSELIARVGITPQKELVYRRKLAKRAAAADPKAGAVDGARVSRLQKKTNRDVRCLILDFASLSHIDPSGASTLKAVIESFQKVDIPVYIAACSDPVYNMIVKCGLFADDSKNPVRIFSTVHDAVECAIETFRIHFTGVSTISRL